MEHGREQLHGTGHLSRDPGAPPLVLPVGNPDPVQDLRAGRDSGRAVQHRPPPTTHTNTHADTRLARIQPPIAPFLCPTIVPKEFCGNATQAHIQVAERTAGIAHRTRPSTPPVPLQAPLAHGSADRYRQQRGAAPCRSSLPPSLSLTRTQTRARAGAGQPVRTCVCTCVTEFTRGPEGVSWA